MDQQQQKQQALCLLRTTRAASQLEENGEQTHHFIGLAVRFVRGCFLFLCHFLLLLNTLLPIASL